MVLNIVGWILSGLLAFAFIGSGVAKGRVSKAKLMEDPRMGWAGDFSGGMVKVIAAAEVLGGIGLIVPWLLNIARVLTPLAAVGLGLVMVGALITHARRGELKQAAPINGILLALAAAVAIIRFSQL